MFFHAKNRRAKNEIGAEGRTRRNKGVSNVVHERAHCRRGYTLVSRREQERAYRHNREGISMYTPRTYIHEVGDIVVHNGRTAVHRGYHERIIDLCYISYVDTPTVTIKVVESTIGN